MTKTAAEIRAEVKKRGQKSGGGGEGWISFKAGDKVYIRIGPPWKKGGEFWKDVAFHGYFKEKVYCRRNEINSKTGEPRFCPVCAYVESHQSDRSTYGKKLWSLIKQNSEGLWNALRVTKVIEVKGRKIAKRYEDGKFKKMRLSTRWQNQLLDIFGDEDYTQESILGVTSPLTGRLIKVSRTGEGREDTTYTFTPMESATPIFKSKEKRLKILKTLIDLDEATTISSKEECEAFLEQMKKRAKHLAKKEDSKGKHDRDDDEEEEDDEEEDVDADEDDEEETDDDGDSDDEDSEDDEGGDLESQYKKAKKSLKKKKKHREDDDDE